MTDATGSPDPEWGRELNDEKPTHDAASCPFGHIGGMCAGDALLGGPHGIFQVLPPRPMPEPRDLDPEEQREAATRYLRARYAQSEAWIDPDVIRGIERVTGETYRLGRWYQEPAAVDEYPEGERDE